MVPNDCVRFRPVCRKGKRPQLYRQLESETNEAKSKYGQCLKRTTHHKKCRKRPWWLPLFTAMAGWPYNITVHWITVHRTAASDPGHVTRSASKRCLSISCWKEEEAYKRETKSKIATIQYYSNAAQGCRFGGAMVTNKSQRLATVAFEVYGLGSFGGFQ